MKFNPIMAEIRGHKGILQRMEARDILVGGVTIIGAYDIELRISELDTVMMEKVAPQEIEFVSEA